MNAVGADQNVAACGCAVRAVAAEEITCDAAFVLRERAEPVSAVDAGFPEACARGLVDDRLQTAAMDRELRIFETSISAARLAPDLLADAVHIEELVSPDSDLVELREQPELRQLLDRVRQRVDTDAEFAHAVGLLENLAVDAPGMQHERRGKPANAAADDDCLHSPRLTLATADIMRLAGRRGNRAAPRRQLTLLSFIGPIAGAKLVFWEEFDHAGYRMQVGGNRGTCICS